MKRPLNLWLLPLTCLRISSLMISSNSSPSSSPTEAPEFEKVSLFETNSLTGKTRSNIFYCDPQTPSQKPHVENNHNLVRNILPNGRKLSSLTQHDLNIMFSHINSVPRKILGGKTPYEVFSFLYSEDILHKLGIVRIQPDAVTLKPFLLEIE